MAKGDHKRSENKSDEQQKMAQGYLTGTQQNIGNQYQANNALYWGNGGAPQYGNTYGYGSTVPNYNTQGQSPYQGNGTDTPSQIGGGGTNYQAQFDQLFPGSNLSPQDLVSKESQLQQMGIRILGPNAAGMRSKIELPNGQIIDVIGGAGAGHNVKQWGEEGGGGGGLGQYGMGGIPGMALNDYANIQGLYGSMIPQYQGLYGDIGSRYGSLYGDMRGQYAPFLGSARNMAETGGLSEADKANLRSRAISPIRSVYSQGLQNVERQRAMQGGYSPGFTTAMGRFNRQMGQQTSDATTNAEAAIAELVQKGKLGGLSAWGSGLGSEGGILNSILGGMTQGQLGALSGQMGAIGGMAGMYGATPGLANMFGNQLQNQMANQLGMGRLQNELSLGLINAQNDIGARVPGNTQGTLENIKRAQSLFGGAAGAMQPWLQDKLGGGRGNGQFRPYDPNTDNPAAYGDPNYVQGSGNTWDSFGNPPYLEFGQQTPISNYYGGQQDYSYVPGYEYNPGAYYGSPVQGYTPTPENW